MTSVIIKPVESGDEIQWRRLWTLYLEYYETTVPEAVFASTFQRILSGDNNEFRAYLAWKDEQPIGLVHYLFHRHCWKIENVCYLQDLFVDEFARGTSVGRALIEAVYAAADAEGCPAVYWLTQDFNEAGRRLYDRVGQLTPFIRYSR